MARQNNIEYDALTDVGMRRASNEDAFAALPAADREQWRHRGHIFLVADGMGAHAVGELASKLAADSIPHIYFKHLDEGPIQALRRAFAETNLTIHNKGQQNTEFEGMGTTATALLLRPEGAWISHVGDSRAYRIRNGSLEQLSFDHSLVWEMARRERCRPEDLAEIPNNVIIRSLGPEPLVQVDIEGPHAVQAGDVFLLCSDGLSGPLSDDVIGAAASVLPPSDACRVLVALANLAGGPDNITCIIVRVDEDISSDYSYDEIPVLFEKKLPWHQRAPWPMWSLLAGIVFALAAILLTLNRIPGGMVSFSLAAMALVVGLVGILIQHKGEASKRQSSEPETGPPKIYRRIRCPVTEQLLDFLAKAHDNAVARIREKNWDMDWSAYERHMQAYLKLREKGKLREAFREACTALLILTETADKHRPKQGLRHHAER